MIKKYKLKMNIGNKNLYGIMKLDIQGNEVSGNFECKNIKGYFNNGIMKDNQIEFSGKIKVFLFGIDYSAKGNINNNKIEIEVNSSRGIYHISGIEY